MPCRYTREWEREKKQISNRSYVDCNLNWNWNALKEININTSHIVLINLLLQMNAIKFYFMRFEKNCADKSKKIVTRRDAREKNHVNSVSFDYETESLKFPKRSPIDLVRFSKTFLLPTRRGWLQLNLSDHRRFFSFICSNQRSTASETRSVKLRRKFILRCILVISKVSTFTSLLHWWSQISHSETIKSGSCKLLFSSFTIIIAFLLVIE